MNKAIVVIVICLSATFVHARRDEVQKFKIGNNTGERISYSYRYCSKDGACTNWKNETIDQIRIHEIRAERGHRIDIRFSDKPGHRRGEIRTRTYDVEGGVNFYERGSRIDLPE